MSGGGRIAGQGLPTKALSRPQVGQLSETHPKYHKQSNQNNIISNLPKNINNPPKKFSQSHQKNYKPSNQQILSQILSWTLPKYYKQSTQKIISKPPRGEYLSTKIWNCLTPGILKLAVLLNSHCVFNIKETQGSTFKISARFIWALPVWGGV